LKAGPVKAAVATLLVCALATLVVVSAIPERNSPEYPVGKLVIPIEELKSILEKIKNLNDTLAYAYASLAERALESGNYIDALYYLQALGQRLRELYSPGSSSGAGLDSETLLSIASLLSSVTSVSERGVEVDLNTLNWFLRVLARSSGSELSIDEVLSTITRLSGNFTGVLQNPSIKLGSSIPGVSGGQASNPLLAPPQLPPISISVPASLSTAIAALAVPVILVSATLYMLRGRVSGLVKRAGVLKHVVAATFTRVSDPVIAVYNKWYLKTRLKGYARCSWETLREYLARVREEELKRVGVVVTELYEKRVYGKTAISAEELERAKRLLGSSGE